MYTVVWVLRLWVRLHCRPVPPDEGDLSREVQEYAVSRLPYMEPALAAAEPGAATSEDAKNEDRAWGMIEID